MNDLQAYILHGSCCTITDHDEPCATCRHACARLCADTICVHVERIIDDRIHQRQLRTMPWLAGE